MLREYSTPAPKQESDSITTQWDISIIEILRLYLLKEIHIYENINSLKVTPSGYTGYFWAPNGELGQNQNP